MGRNQHINGIGALTCIIAVLIYGGNFFYNLFLTSGSLTTRFLAALGPGGWEGMLLVFVISLALAVPIWLLCWLVMRVIRK